ncbi:hypothetical protein [Wolbachia pipientis]|uniref:hypothetical protein n=1 Tax=Wolbachia pipientis TaxID=955 RepID=UPI0025A41988|nr:hypothetical protein [Wolbachia pipientis]MDM8335257.1 hypothetical protein [Wolbachia pipientis]
MSTNWLHDLLFGSDELKIKALEQAQQVDAEQFQKAFSALKGLQKSQQIDAGQFKNIHEYLNGLQENFTGLEEKVETLTEAVGEQEKIMLTCCIVASVVAVAAISFIGFCIYQGVKSERNKQNNLSDTSGARLNNLGESNNPNAKLGIDGKLNNLQVDDLQNNNLLAANV